MESWRYTRPLTQSTSYDKPSYTTTSNYFMSQPTMVHLSLTPVHDKLDSRTIYLTQNRSTQSIGRSSKTSGKGMEADSMNALFDCPVISRKHAELRYHPLDPRGEMSVIDQDSMHGTYVNTRKLGHGEPYYLRSGDEIQLGDRVTRGAETHTGLRLIYELHDADQQTSTQGRLNASTNTFAVPSASEDEDDDDNSSVGIAPHFTSSAKTTPEKTAMLGSQDKPIDLSQADTRRRSVVNLVDEDDEDDEELFGGRASKPAVTYRKEERTFVKDTYDNGEEDLEALWRAGSKPNGSGYMHNYSKPSAEESDLVNPREIARAVAENAMSRGYGGQPSQALGRVSLVDDDSVSEASSDSGIVPQVEDEDDLSDSDASSIAGSITYVTKDESSDAASVPSDDEEEEEEEDEDRPEELSSSMRQPSPELGGPLHVASSSSASQPAPATSTFGYPHSAFAPYVPASQPRYDPVRGLDTNPPVQPSQKSHYEATLAKYGIQHTYSSFTGAGAPAEPRTTRWDVPPTGVLPAPTKPLDNNTQFYSYAPDTASHKPYYLYPTTAQPNRYSMTFADQQERDIDIKAERALKEKVAGAKTDSVKVRMDVDSLVNGPAANRETEFGDMFMTPAVPSTTAAGASTTVTGSKRKATAMEDGADREKSHWFNKLLKDDGNDVNDEDRHGGAPDEEIELLQVAPPRKKVKSVKTMEKSKTAGVAKEVVKYAAAATAGGAGMMAFLASPLAGKVLEWLT
ncbi:hypothetical protein LTR97_000061 [Elasticomyces elasticus]|uniref:FHA domain-containing protein n=1 Tax=Elasticomyces elasticus TaxID=574655 RepID=A0AAN7ZW88_9PEZI|nr:hypothetical protein LTR97_000061 [Elasticomyces elasticus]